MIKKLEAEEIAKILNIDDANLTETFPCEVGEWAQFLMQHINNPRFFMRGVLEKDKLISYLIAVNSTSHPISKSVHILYYSTTADKDNNNAIIDELIKWSKEKGAVSISLVTDNPSGYTTYKFKRKATMMVMDL